MTEAMSLYNLDKAYLSQKAAESGFVRDTLEKVYRLADVLRGIGQSLTPSIDKLGIYRFRR